MIRRDPGVARRYPDHVRRRAGGRRSAAAYHETSPPLAAAQNALEDVKGVVAAKQAEAAQADRDAGSAPAAQGVADHLYAAAAGRVNQVEAQIKAVMSTSYRGSGLIAISALLGTPSGSQLADGLAILDRDARRQHQALIGYLNAQIAAKEADNAAVGARQRADAATAVARRALAVAQAVAATADSTSTTVSPSHGAYFLTPVHGWKSSDFGMRFDP